jgi:regulator of protease activity HflC (stomatin/prohibitin superfamily)
MSLKSISSTLKKFAALIIIGLLAFLFINRGYFQTEAGFTYHYQNTVTGAVEVYTEPGVHFRLPWFSKVTRYKQVVTISFGSTTKIGDAVIVRFADTYTGQIPATFRYKLPLDPDKIGKIHRDFRSSENLAGALLVKTSLDV